MMIAGLAAQDEALENIRLSTLAFLRNVHGFNDEELRTIQKLKAFKQLVGRNGPLYAFYQEQEEESARRRPIVKPISWLLDGRPDLLEFALEAVRRIRREKKEIGINRILVEKEDENLAAMDEGALPGLTGNEIAGDIRAAMEDQGRGVDEDQRKIRSDRARRAQNDAKKKIFQLSCRSSLALLP